MKKAFTLLLLAALSLAATAQSLDRIGEPKNFTVRPAEHSHLAGKADGRYYLAFNTPNNLNNGPVGVATFDEQFKPLKRAKLKLPKGIAVRDARLAGGDMLLLLHDRKHRDHPAYYVARLDPATLALRTPPASVHAEQTDRRDKAVWGFAVSPNRQYTALLSVVLDKKEKSVSDARITLLDSAYNVLWSRTSSLHSTGEDMCVTDEGMVVVFGSYAFKGGVTIGVDAFTDSDSLVVSRNVELTGLGKCFTHDLSIASERDGRLLLVGNVMANPDGKFTPNDAYQGKCATRGCLAIGYDFIDDRVLGHEVHLFTREECQSMQDLMSSNDRKLRGKTVSDEDIMCGLNGLYTRHFTPTPYGAAFDMTARFTTIVTSNNATTRTDYLWGTFLFGVDTLGHFRWSNIVPTNTVNVNRRVFREHFLLLCDGNDVLYLQNENDRATSSAPLSECKAYTYPKSCKIGLYRIGPRGQMEASHQSSAQPMVQSFRLGREHLILTSANKSCVYKLNVKQ